MGSNIEITKATIEKISGNHGCFSAQLFIGAIIFSSIQSFIKSNPLIKISTLKYGCYRFINGHKNKTPEGVFNGYVFSCFCIPNNEPLIS